MIFVVVCSYQKMTIPRSCWRELVSSRESTTVPAERELIILTLCRAMGKYKWQWSITTLLQLWDMAWETCSRKSIEMSWWHGFAQKVTPTNLTLCITMGRTAFTAFAPMFWHIWLVPLYVQIVGLKIFFGSPTSELIDQQFRPFNLNFVVFVVPSHWSTSHTICLSDPQISFFFCNGPNCLVCKLWSERFKENLGPNS